MKCGLCEGLWCVMVCEVMVLSMQIGKLEESISDCSKAIELDPRYTKAFQRRAKLLVLTL